jgi:hypothetical protein
LQINDRLSHPEHQRIFQEPALLQIGQALVYGRDEFLQGGQLVRMRVPAGGLHLDEGDPRLDQPPRHQAASE